MFTLCCADVLLFTDLGIKKVIMKLYNFLIPKSVNNDGKINILAALLNHCFLVFVEIARGKLNL